MSKQQRPPDQVRERAWAKTLKTVGRRVRHFRTQLKASQSDLGAATGTDKTAIGRLERGRVAPSMERLHRAAHYLDVPFYRLFLDDEEEAPIEAVAEFARLADGIHPSKGKALLEMVRSIAQLEGIDTRPKASIKPSSQGTSQRVSSKLKTPATPKEVDDLRHRMKRGVPLDEPTGPTTIDEMRSGLRDGSYYDQPPDDAHDTDTSDE